MQEVERIRRAGLGRIPFICCMKMKDRGQVFIKEQYGIGGSSHALSGADDSHANYDGKGLFLARGAYGNPYTSILLSWNKVANRVAYLIKNDQFLQAEDYARMPEYEREQMANKVLRFYDRLPEEMDRPFTEDFFWENQEKK